MDLSSKLVKDFAKQIVEAQNEKETPVVQLLGTVSVSGGNTYVILDGSGGNLTPVSNTVDYSNGDRVLVTIQNRTATIIGNYTEPSINEALGNVAVEYALSSSDSEFVAWPGTKGQWNATAPSREDGSYMWQRTTKVSTSGGTPIVSMTCIQGADGEDGSAPTYSEDEPLNVPPNSLWVKISTGDIFIYENGEWVPLTTEYVTGPELDSSIESKVYETFYAYADDDSGTNFSLVETGKQYRGIYTTASGIQSSDYRDYIWELNPLWASQVASNYISEQSGGLKILTPDAKTYAGLTGLALAFYLGGVEQARLGYLFEGSTKAAYGVIAQDIFAYGSGAGVKFDNSNQASSRGRFTWEIRDNGHLSLKKY